MDEDEFNRVFSEPTDKPQLFLLESRDPRRIVFALVVRFPPGQRVVRLVEDIPSARHLIDPQRAVYYVGAVRDKLMKRDKPGDDDLLNWTNWVSMVAAVRGLIIEFNNAQAKRAAPDQPAGRMH